MGARAPFGRTEARPPVVEGPQGRLTARLLRGRELGINKHTVAKHLQHAYAKLGVSNRTAAVHATGIGATDRKE